MSYNPAYTTRFSGLDGTLWEIVIGINGFDGAPMEISLEGDEPCVIDWQETGKMDVVQPATCTLRVSNEKDRQMAPLMNHPDSAIQVSRDGKVYWFGHLDDAVYEEPYSFKTAYVTELTFSDFGILNRLPFTLTGRQSVWAIVRDCLESVGYVNGEPVSLLTSLLHPKTHEPVTLDMLHINADRFAADGDEPTTKREALEEALRPLGLRIIQKNARIHIYDIEYLRDHADTMANYPVWKGTDAWLRGSETFGRIDVSFEPDAGETLADDGLDYDYYQWNDSETYFCKSYDPEQGDDTDIGFYIEMSDLITVAKVAKSANARFFRTRSAFTDSNDIGMAWRIRCKRLVGYYNSPIYGQLPLVNDCVLAGNSPAPSLAATEKVFSIETGYLPLVPDARKYQLRVSLDFLLSFRDNPLDSPPDEWVEQQDWYYSPPLSKEKVWRSAGLFGIAVPVKLEVIDEEGNPVCHYVNAYTEDKVIEPFGNQVVSAFVHPRGIGKGFWSDEHDESWCRMILSYYKDYDPDEDDRDPLVTSGWVGNRISVSSFGQDRGTLYRRRADGEYLPLPPVAGRLRLTVGSGVFIVGGGDGVHTRLYPCYPNFAWQLYRNPQVALVKADRKDDGIPTDDVSVRDHFDILGDRLGETLQAGTWQKGIAPSARGLLYDAEGNAWERFLKCGGTGTLAYLRLISLIEQNRFAQPVISGTAELCHVFCAFKEWSTEGTFLPLAIRQDLHQYTEQLTMVRIGSRDDEPGGGQGGGIYPGTPFSAAWSNPVCAEEEPRFAFVWANPLCIQAPGPYQAEWDGPLCTERYSYDLNWEDMEPIADG